MLGKAQAKLIKMLQQKKQRKKEGLFVVEGDKMVRESLNSKFNIHKVFATENWLYKTGVLAPETQFLQIAEESELKKISSLTTPQEVLAIIEIPSFKLDADPQNQLVLALDKVKDPGNLGTIIRIADWFGIKDIVCSNDCVDVYNPKVIQATMGSIFRVKIHYLELKEWLEKQNCTIYGAVLNGENLWKEKLDAHGILLMGNESKGVSDELLKLINKPLAIPSFGGAESLNVAVATAIFCAEFSKINFQG